MFIPNLNIFRALICSSSGKINCISTTSSICHCAM